MKTEDLVLFNAVAEHLSLSGAARALDISLSKVCRHMAQLEQHLGVRLMERTTRTLVLTDAGIEFLERSTKILADVEALELSVGQLQIQPEGKVTIAAPLDFINLALSDALHQFRLRYPKLQLKFVSYQSRQNPMDVQADLVLFLGHTSPPDCSMVAQKLSSSARCFVASPDFIAKHPQLTHPRQLVNYPCLLSAKGAESANVWLWTDDNQSHSVEVDGPLESEAIELCISAAAQGGGVAWVPPVMCQEYFESGRLQSLFDGQYSSTVSLWGLYPSRHYVPHRVRVILDFFREEFSRLNLAR